MLAVRGQATLEAALIIPVLLFLLMGLFVVGAWLNAKQIVTAAAREGARVAALTGDRCAAATAVNQVMRALNIQNVTMEVPNPLPPQGSPLVVRVVYALPLMFDYFKSEYERINNQEAYPFSIVSAQATARMEVEPLGVVNC